MQALKKGEVYPRHANDCNPLKIKIIPPRLLLSFFFYLLKLTHRIKYTLIFGVQLDSLVKDSLETT